MNIKAGRLFGSAGKTRYPNYNWNEKRYQKIKKQNQNITVQIG